MVIDEKTYFAFVLALGDQFMDLQKNGNTYTERVKIDSYGHTAEINVSKYYNKYLLFYVQYFRKQNNQFE